jgi:hypothetical protein
MKPEITLPLWWSDRDGKMQAELLDQNNLIIKNEGETAKLMISRKSQEFWLLMWEITFGQKEINGEKIPEKASGQFFLKKAGLEAAFTKVGENIPATCFLEYNARGDLGKFIRDDRFLKIPGPGIACRRFDPDPSISIYLTDEIQQEVAHLLRKKNKE